MICARDGWLEPQRGQSVYVLKDTEGKALGVTLRYTAVVRHMGLPHSQVADFEEVPWLD